MEEKSGLVMISPQVLTTIARQATLNVPGVMSMSPGISFNRFLRRGKGRQGVRVAVEEGAVSIDLFIIVEPQVNMLHLGQEIQREVTRAIQDLVGMPVREVNVHIEDVIPEKRGEEEVDESST
ncbi:MAG: Asp23/Gls24 family envelope stress response protein [Anaerolineae bacterium]